MPGISDLEPMGYQLPGPATSTGRISLDIIGGTGVAQPGLGAIQVTLIHLATGTQYAAILNNSVVQHLAPSGTVPRKVKIRNAALRLVDGSVEVSGDPDESKAALPPPAGDGEVTVTIGPWGFPPMKSEPIDEL